MRQRTRVLFIVACAAAWVAACGEDLTIAADQTNAAQSFVASAMTGTPPNAPAALNFINRAITRLDGGFDFDVAFDIDAQNRPVILPLGLVGTPVAGARQVGLQRVTGTFDAITSAPRNGYHFDSTMAVQFGQVVVVYSNSALCSVSLTPYIFAKIVIDSIRPSTRELYGRTLIDLNCGFHSLEPGIPKKQ